MTQDEGALGPAPLAPLDQVEWRVDSKPYPRSSGMVCRYVPYLDAATVAGLLDEWVGPGRWADTYQEATLSGRPVLWCSLAVRVDGEWVAKSDVGVPSEFEAQKGMVSDAFKRAACLKWGAGRNVYDLPVLYAPCRVDDKGNAWPVDETIPSLIDQLRRQGFDASGAKVRGGQAEATSAATSQPRAVSDEPKAPPADNLLERINSLGLAGREVTKLRSLLAGHGLPWPPNDLTDEQTVAFDEVLASFQAAS